MNITKRVFAYSELLASLSDARIYLNRARYHYIVRGRKGWKTTYQGACRDMALCYLMIAQHGYSTYNWRCRYFKTAERWLKRADSAR